MDECEPLIGGGSTAFATALAANAAKEGIALDSTAGAYTRPLLSST
jgi:hypothetical protein